jgi:recombination protein RecT
MNEVTEQKKQTVKSFFDREDVKAKMNELMGKNAASFATSVLQIVNSNAMLKDAEPASIFNAACMAATLNLPINNNLGFAYIVPYKKNFKDGSGKWCNVIEAQFQLGYKGFIQLAQRSGQFKTISASRVCDGQLISENPLTGYEFNWSNKQSDKVIGYVAYFKLLNGFEAWLYMSDAEIRKHATDYSQTFKTGKGVWVDKYEAMALKTVLKLLLSKQAPLSIEMQSAVLADQSIVKDVESKEFEYIDHQAADTPILIDLSNNPDLYAKVLANVQNGSLDKISVLSGESYSFNEDQQKELSAC